MIERQIEIQTEDGRMNTFICHPERLGPHPAVIFLMDAPGIREELRDMARRLGTVGYYVMLPNLYYRSGVEELGPFVGEAHTATRQKLMQLMGTINIPMVMQDIDALVAFAAEDGAASSGAMGCVGYCMSGQYAVNAAVRHPDRIRAAASIHGISAGDRQARQSAPRAAAHQRSTVFRLRRDRSARAPRDDRCACEPNLRRSEPMPRWRFIRARSTDSPFRSALSYNKPAAERHWERLFALFGDALT